MKIGVKTIRQIIEITLLALFVIGLVSVFNWFLGGVSRNERGSPLSAYPPPPYPPPRENIISSATPSPRTPATPGPPSGWPTDQPWPPLSTGYTPPPSTPAPPFPTPVLRSTSTGSRPANLQQLWYPFFPNLASKPLLKAIMLDEQNYNWGTVDHSNALEIPLPYEGPDPGPVLLVFHVSPSYRWIVADFAYTGSQLVDLSSDLTIPLYSSEPGAGWRFLSWNPPGESMFVSSSHGYQLIDLPTLKADVVKILDFTAENPYLSTVAISPDGALIADAVVNPPTVGVRNVSVTEIGLRKGLHEKRQMLIQIDQGIIVVDHSLVWSPDGNKLIWIVCVA